VEQFPTAMALPRPNIVSHILKQAKRKEERVKNGYCTKSPLGGGNGSGKIIILQGRCRDSEEREKNYVRRHLIHQSGTSCVISGN
jgi:hypothetical protein